MKMDHRMIQKIQILLNEAQGIIDRSSYLTNARAIKAWIEKSGGTKPPNRRSKDEEERRLGIALGTIRSSFIKLYISLETEEEREKFREQHPETDEVLEIVHKIDENNIPIKLIQARAIKAWIEQSGGTKPPSISSKNEDEKRLGIELSNIRQNLIKPYISLETEEEMEKFREEHPEIDEVLEIVNEIDRNNISPYLINARAIKAWIEQSGGTKPPSQTSKNEDERRLGIALNSIRRFKKSYISLQTEEEREKFREEHPEIDEVLEVINEIDENNVHPYLKNARIIKEWVEKSKTMKLPSRYSKDEEEKRLGELANNIRKNWIKPYMSLETEAERGKFREEHPEIDEVLDIISKLDMQCGTKKQQELAILIRQDLEKEKHYKKQKNQNKIMNNKKQRICLFKSDLV